VSGRLQTEIKQSRPFQSASEEAYLNLLKTADLLSQAVNATLKRFGLSETQYNVLRILRGAGKNGLACREIGSRMVTRDPDITRLLDRLEARGLVVRSREERDRRIIVTRITRDGLALLSELDRPLSEVLEGKLRHVGIEKLRALIELLELVRGG
jgi:DNA-binding MarR family transcriptional regulator